MKKPIHLRILLVVLLISSAFQVGSKQDSACVIIKDDSYISKSRSADAKTVTAKTEFWKIDDEF